MDDTVRLQANDIHVRDLTAAEISAYQRDGVVHLPAAGPSLHGLSERR